MAQATTIATAPATTVIETLQNVPTNNRSPPPPPPPPHRHEALNAVVFPLLALGAPALVAKMKTEKHGPRRVQA